MHSTTRRVTLLSFSTVLALALCATAHAGPVCPASPAGGPVCTLSIGSDYFQTQTGTFFNFGSPIGVVNFVGVPVGPGSTDTIVQRLNEPFLVPGGAPGTVNSMLTTLSLESMVPVTLGPDSYNVFVTLDAANLAKDTGTLLVSLNATATGGTFDSSLNVYFDASFKQIGGPLNPIPDVFQHIAFNSTGNLWSTTPAAGSLLVSGPDDGGSGDQAGNIHTGLDAGELDFFPGTVIHSAPGDSHAVAPTPNPTPEPGSLLLFFTAIPGLVILRRKILSRAAR